MNSFSLDKHYSRLLSLFVFFFFFNLSFVKLLHLSVRVRLSQHPPNDTTLHPRSD